MAKKVLTRSELQERLDWQLERKLQHFVNTFADYHLDQEGHIYLSYSAGKDSQVGCDIIDKIYDGTFRHYLPDGVWKYIISKPKPPKVFCNTGLEFPEIVDHAKKSENLIILKPRMGFTRVIKEVGVAVGSKKIAMQIARLKKYIASPSPKNEATKNLYLYGVKKDGTLSKSSKLSEKWQPLLDAPFLVSDQCCTIFKKEPFHKYEKETGRKPVVFTTVGESSDRLTSYLKTGCISYEVGKIKCRPLSIFNEENIWEYHNLYGLRFAEVYYDRTLLVEQVDGSKEIKHLVAETRTGCTFCMFGVHMESDEKPNRIQRLAESHPKYYDVVVNKCGLGEILAYLKIPYRPFRKMGCGKQMSLF